MVFFGGRGDDLGVFDWVVGVYRHKKRDHKIPFFMPELLNAYLTLNGLFNFFSTRSSFSRAILGSPFS